MCELAKILEKIDHIADNQTFCDAERNAVFDYCYEHDFDMTDEEIAIIKSRGLYDSYLYWIEIYM